MTTSLTLHQLITSDSLLREYFRANSNRHQADLALQLLREAISGRMQAVPSGKHYHVAYIKHNRFLSPSQKQEVTDKVTQIIPVNEKPLKIYAKPKPKPQDNEALQAQSEKEIQTREEIASREALPEPVGERKGRQNVIDSQKELEREDSKRDESEKYLSPKTKPKQQPVVKNKSKVKQFVSPPTKATPTAYHSPRAAHSTGGLNIQSNYRSAVRERVEMGSPKLPRQDYGRVESRIKFLIDRDKQSKRMELALQAQGHKIEKLEERQERLLLLQYEQERQLLRTNHHHQQRDSLSESDSESSEANRLSKISERLEAINSRAEGVRDYQHALYANLERMKDKTYKISSNPVYPISSSQSDDDL